MSPGEWGAELARALGERGLEPERADALTADALAEARDAGRAPADLYGPAHAYAGELVRAAALAERTGGRLLVAAAEPGPVRLRLTDVTKSYGRTRVLAGVSLEVRAGEVAAVVGANGAGKSTLLGICAGLVRPTSGRVERSASVGLVPQDGGTAPLLTADEHFELFGAGRGLPRGHARASGTRLAARLGWRPTRAVASQLSGGTRQKLNLILGELARPELLLLDEPYQGFDQGTYLDFWEQVRAWRDTGTAVVVVTHLLHDLDLADRVVELARPEGR